MDRVGRKGAETGVDVLIIAYVRHNLIKNTKPAPLLGRDMNTGLGHKTQQAKRLKRNRLPPPVGSGNDIPGAIGIIPNVKRACEIITEGNTGKNDVGLTINAKNETRYFLGIGSQGFDGAVAEKVNAHEKKYSGTWNYVIMLIKTIFQFKKTGDNVNIEVDFFAKYIEQFMNKTGETKISSEWLKQQGF